MAAEIDADMKSHERWMREALLLAQQAGDADEVPVGAVVVREGEIIGRGFNQPIRTYDATAHAEIVAIRSASQFCNNYRLPGTTLYVTIEPCTMCLGAMIHARIGTLVFGAAEPRAGAVVSQASLIDAQHFNHKISYVQGVLADDCAALMQAFFKSRRQGN
ncbi:MAG: tRNA-specific adenosine deaminase [Pseudohongiella sp.]|nr:MAG: tRNA-specific adenosine deaminase [Pseudohongiella sp.]